MRTLAEVTLWWLLLFAGYLQLITAPTGWEVPAGAAVAAAGAAMAVLSRRAFAPATAFPDFARRVVLLPVDVVTDAVTLVRLLVTGRALEADAGELGELRLADDEPATRAWAVLLTSASPGSLAVDSEDGRGHTVLTVHRLTRPGRVTAGLER